MPVILQVHRGTAEVYLSFLRINIALESGGHRVQLQSIVDEEEASPTTASTMMRSRLFNFMFVHWRNSQITQR